MLNLCLIAAVGCEDSPARQSELRIMAEIARANRLCDRAQSMSGGVLFFVRDDPAPRFETLKGELVPADVTFGIESKDEQNPQALMKALDRLNPQALTALDEARKALKGVLGEAEAPALAQALAKDALARVRSLQGQAEAYKANIVRRQVARIAAAINETLPIASAQANALDYVQDVVTRSGGSTDDSIKSGIAKLIEGVKSEIGQLDTDMKALQGVVTERTAARDALVKQSSAFRGQVGEMEQKRALATGAQKITLIQQIEAKQIELDKSVRQTGEAEAAVADANGSITRLQTVIAAANARLATLASSEADRKTAAGVQDAAGKSADERIAKTREAIGKDLVALAAAWTELDRQERAAQVCYDDAAGLLDKARKILSGVGGDEFGSSGNAIGGLSPAAAAAKTRTEAIVGLAVSQGRAHVSSAELDIASLLQHDTNVRLAAGIEKLWPRILPRKDRASAGAGGGAPPEEVSTALSTITGLAVRKGAGPASDKLTGAAARNAAAALKYKLAEKAFRDAVKEQSPTLKWMDRGLLAGALYMYGVCARDSVSIKDAQDQIKKAIDRRIDSPLVARSLRPIKEMLTFGANAFVTVTDVSADGEMLLEQGAEKGTFVKTFGQGRTGKDLPGAVYVAGREIQRGQVSHPKGTILLRVAGGQYLPAPAGLVLTIPADMTILGQSYKKGDEVVVPSDSKMAGAE